MFASASKRTNARLAMIDPALSRMSRSRPRSMVGRAAAAAEMIGSGGFTIALMSLTVFVAGSGLAGWASVGPAGAAAPGLAGTAAPGVAGAGRAAPVVAAAAAVTAAVGEARPIAVAVAAGFTVGAWPSTEAVSSAKTTFGTGK